MKKFVFEIFKYNRSGNPDEEEAPRIEGCVNPNIKEKYNLPIKTSAVDYADMFLPLTKNICRVKILCRPFINWHSGKI